MAEPVQVHIAKKLVYINKSYMQISFISDNEVFYYYIGNQR